MGWLIEVVSAEVQEAQEAKLLELLSHLSDEGFSLAYSKQAVLELATRLAGPLYARLVPMYDLGNIVAYNLRFYNVTFSLYCYDMQEEGDNVGDLAEGGQLIYEF